LNKDAPVFVPGKVVIDWSPERKLLKKEEVGFKSKRKTELCRNFTEGKCPFANDCAFSHGTDELRKKTHVASRYKLALCQGYHGI
jgi:hypothetical protein